MLIANNILFSEPVATGCQKTMFSNRISKTFNFAGPGSVVDTACSSSLYAMHQAVTAIRNGVCHSAIVGAANILLSSKNSLRSSRYGMLSPDGACKSFDSSGDGYVRYTLFRNKFQILINIFQVIFYL